MSEVFDPYHSWLGIPPAEQPPNHYRLLGITLFEDKPDAIENAADQRMGHLKSFQAGKHSALSQRLLNEVAAARVCLLKPDKKAAYDTQLRAEIHSQAEPSDDSLDSGLKEAIQQAQTRKATALSQPVRKPPPNVLAFIATGVGMAMVLLTLIVWMSPSGKQPEVVVKQETPKAKSGEPKAEEGKPPATPPLAVAPFDEKQAREHQRRWAEYLGVPVELTNSIGMKFILIPPGEFEMGSTPEETAAALEEAKKSNDSWALARIPGEEPRHRVRLSRPYYLGVYEVTQGEYTQVIGVNPSAFTEKQMAAALFTPALPESANKNRLADAKKVAGKDTSRHPVETVSWDDAAQFLQKLSALPAETSARRVYRLPSEAEWEHACRAGTTTRWSSGDEESVVLGYGWFVKNSGATPHPVGKKKPNGFGLYDMHGNVWEWCLEWYAKDYYGKSPAVDPPGPDNGSDHVYRGGTWRYGAWFGRCAFRNNYGSNHRFSHLGFRACLVLAE